MTVREHTVQRDIKICFKHHPLCLLLESDLRVVKLDQWDRDECDGIYLGSVLPVV